MTDTDFLKVLNAVVKIAKPYHKEAPEITDLDTDFKNTNIDSLDLLMVGIYLGDVFGISEEDGKQLMVTNVRQLFEVVKKVATKFPDDVDKAIGDLK